MGRDRGRGSVLALFPAAVLVLVVLAAIAVDLAIVQLGQRELANASVAAANDAATLGLSEAAFYEGGEVEPDPDRVARVAEEVVRSSLDPRRHHGLAVSTETLPPGRAGCSWTVVVRVAAEVDLLFARALPGAADRVAVRAVARASPRGAAGGC